MITWKSYAKIADEVFSSAGISVKMNVSLYKDIPMQDGTKRRRLFHMEYGYKDKEGVDTYSIHRTFDYYLSIENTNRLDSGYKEFVRIGVTEIDNFRAELFRVYQWIRYPEKIYTTDSNGRLYIDKEVKPVFIGGLPPKNRFMAFEPAIGDSETPYKAIKIVFNSQANIIIMPMNRFLGFYHVMMNVNLYDAAQNLLSYIGRPTFGSNLFKQGEN